MISDDDPPLLGDGDQPIAIELSHVEDSALPSSTREGTGTVIPSQLSDPSDDLASGSEDSKLGVEAVNPKPSDPSNSPGFSGEFSTAEPGFTMLLNLEESPIDSGIDSGEGAGIDESLSSSLMADSAVYQPQSMEASSPSDGVLKELGSAANQGATGTAISGAMDRSSGTATATMSSSPIADQLSHHDSMMNQLESSATGSKNLSLSDPNFSLIGPASGSSSATGQTSLAVGNNASDMMSSTVGAGATIASAEPEHTFQLDLSEGTERDGQLFENLGVANPGGPGDNTSQSSTQTQTKTKENNLSADDGSMSHEIWDDEGGDGGGNETYRSEMGTLAGDASHMSAQASSPDVSVPGGKASGIASLSGAWESYKNLVVVVVLVVGAGFASYTVLGPQKITELITLAKDQAQQLINNGAGTSSNTPASSGVDDYDYDNGDDYSEDDYGADEPDLMASGPSSDSNSSPSPSPSDADSRGSGVGTEEINVSEQLSNSEKPQKVMLRSEVLNSDDSPYVSLPTRELNLLVSEDTPIEEAPAPIQSGKTLNHPPTSTFFDVIAGDRSEPSESRDNSTELAVAFDEPWPLEKLEQMGNSQVIWHRFEFIDQVRKQSLVTPKYREKLWAWVEENNKLWLTLAALSALIALEETVTQKHVKKAYQAHNHIKVSRWMRRFRSGSYDSGDKTLIRMLIQHGTGAMRYAGIRTLLVDPDTLSRAYVAACQRDPYPRLAVRCERWSAQISNYKERLLWESVLKGEQTYQDAVLPPDEELEAGEASEASA